MPFRGVNNPKCKYSADSFCYICGEYTLLRGKRKFPMDNVSDIYLAYFGMQVENQDKPWAPHFTCSACYRTLQAWYRGEKRSMKFAIPRIWRKPGRHHETDCFFCMVNVPTRLPPRRQMGRNARNSLVEYPNIPSSTAPVPHDAERPVPIPPKRNTSNNENTDPVANTSGMNQGPNLPNRSEIVELINLLDLDEERGEILKSWFRERNLIDQRIRKRSRGANVSELSDDDSD